MSELKKPPLGLIPEFYWKRNRVHAIRAAMARYVAADKEIPSEWGKELYLLVREGKGYVD